MKKPKIAIVGPGVVGKATGRAFIDKGFEVGFIGRSEEQIEKLRAEGYTAYGRKDMMDGDYDYDITFFTVSTPTHNGKINLDGMELAALDLAKRLRKTKNYHVVVVKSTCPPGTTESLVLKTLEEFSGKKAGKDFGVCMNPEYLREVSAYEDSIKPWLIVIGEYDKKSGDTLEQVYKSFKAPIYRCSLAEAEMQKYVHNLFNAVKITFFNEMRQVAKKIGSDADKIFHYTTLSSEGILNPVYGTKDKGPYSGACLPKDTKAFLHFAKSKKMDLPLLKATIEVNEKLKETPAAILATNGKSNGENHNEYAEKLRELEQNAEYSL